MGIRIARFQRARYLALPLLALALVFGPSRQGSGVLFMGLLRPAFAVPARLDVATQPPEPIRGAASRLADPDQQLIVLAYHEIAEPGQAISPDYAVTPAALASQLDWLRRHGYHFVSVDQLLAARSGKAPLPPRPVLLSFDDGYASVYSQAFPLLKRYQAPALVAVVGHWLEPTQGKVAFGESLIDRQQLLSWEQLRTMQRSGLVEVASHSFDLHHGINGNPQGNQMPAATTRLYDPQRGYESEASYRQRLRQDLSRSLAQIETKLGRRPRVIVWPYGRYNAAAEAVARQLGLAIGLNLDDGANTGSVPLGALRRVLMTAEMGPLAGLQQELDLRRRNLGDSGRSNRVMHVDLDYIDDPDPAQVERNLQLLLTRIRAMGVNTVYLQAYADPDGNGAANALYFPNRYLPVKRDLFSHVAWEIRTRTPVRRLYAWMPVLAFELPRGVPGFDQRVVTQPSRRGVLTMGYPRLSPFAPTAMATVRGIYADLARSARFDGLLFHDDVTLTDYEDASAFGLRQYKAWGLPTDLASIRASDALMGQWTNRKVAALERLTLQLAALVRAEQPQLSTARNLYAQVVLNPHAESWYAQAYDAALRDYDFAAVMAMPQMEQARDADAFLVELVNKVKEQPGGLEHTVFELQSTDWNTRQDIPSPVLAAQLRRLNALGVRHAGYYPDNLHRGTPDPEVLHQAFQQLGVPRPRS